MRSPYPPPPAPRPPCSSARPRSAGEGINPIRFWLIHIIVFKNEMDPVAIAAIDHGVHRHVVHFDSLTLRKMVADTVNLKHNVGVRLQRHVYLVRPLGGRVAVAVRMNDPRQAPYVQA